MVRDYKKHQECSRTVTLSKPVRVICSLETLRSLCLSQYGHTAWWRDPTRTHLLGREPKPRREVLISQNKICLDLAEIDIFSGIKHDFE